MALKVGLVGVSPALSGVAHCALVEASFKIYSKNDVPLSEPVCLLLDS